MSKRKQEEEKGEEISQIENDIETFQVLHSNRITFIWY